MAQPTMPPPGGRTSPLDQFWRWFAGLPTWGRAVAWFLLWPVLVAARLLGAGSRSREIRYGTSAAVLLVGGFVWSQVLTGGFTEAPAAVTAEPAAETVDETRREVEPGPEPGPDEARTAEAALAAIADEGADLGAPAVTEPDADEVAADDEHDVRVEPEGPGWTVFNVVDGDTVDVRATDGSEERVRIIGIDTPERGECGFGPAASKLAELVEGRDVVLVAGARDDRDRYDRILRYIDVDGTDAGHELIKAGLAIARYDSRDGYGPHPREADYIAAQAAATAFGCPVTGPSPSPTATPTPAATPSATPTLAPPPRPPATGGPGSGPGGAWKNCSEARDAGAAPVHRDDPGYGKHLDRDGDGIGCE